MAIIRLRAMVHVVHLGILFGHPEMQQGLSRLRYRSICGKWIDGPDARVVDDLEPETWLARHQGLREPLRLHVSRCPRSLHVCCVGVQHFDHSCHWRTVV